MCRRRTLPRAAPDAAVASKQGADGEGGESRAGLEQVQESASRALEDLVVQLEDSVDNQVRPCISGQCCIAFSSSSSLPENARLLFCDLPVRLPLNGFCCAPQEAENELEGIVGTYDFSEEEKDTFRSLVANMRATATGLLAAAGVNVLFLIIKRVPLDWCMFEAGCMCFGVAGRRCAATQSSSPAEYGALSEQVWHGCCLQHVVH